jgi:hypothetical protein
LKGDAAEDHDRHEVCCLFQVQSEPPDLHRRKAVERAQHQARSDRADGAER